MTAWYLDASALVKLATQEAETDALRNHLGAGSSPVTSRVAAVEVGRALARKGPESREVAAATLEAAREALVTVELDAAIAEVAAALQPPSLRSLDAIHLASALALGGELAGFVTYDARLADAARAVGLTVVAPA